jgi:hypothetical protein
MFRRITTLLAVAAGLAAPLALTAPAGAQTAVTVTVRSASLVVPCGTGTSTGSTTVDWLVPDGVPSGVVWVQHGFSRNRGNVRDLATRIARDTRSIVIAPNAGPCGGINATGFHQGIARLFGDRQALLQSSYTAAVTGLAGVAATLPDAYVLTGHSAGGNAATAAAGFAVDVPGGDLANLRGVVLFDPVENGGAMTAALAKLPASVPVATISAPNSSCNASSTGTVALRAARSGFIGFRLARGSHTDAEGPNSGFLANVVCGFPRSENVAALRTLATGWVGDQLAGRFGSGVGVYAPSGAVVAVGAASATSL